MAIRSSGRSGAHSAIVAANLMPFVPAVIRESPLIRNVFQAGADRRSSRLAIIGVAGLAAGSTGGRPKVANKA